MTSPIPRGTVSIVSVIQKANTKTHESNPGHRKFVQTSSNELHPPKFIWSLPDHRKPIITFPIRYRLPRSSYSLYTNQHDFRSSFLMNDLALPTNVAINQHRASHNSFKHSTTRLETMLMPMNNKSILRAFFFFLTLFQFILKVKTSLYLHFIIFTTFWLLVYRVVSSNSYKKWIYPTIQKGETKFSFDMNTILRTDIISNDSQPTSKLFLPKNHQQCYQDFTLYQMLQKLCCHQLAYQIVAAIEIPYFSISRLISSVYNLIGLA